MSVREVPDLDSKIYLGNMNVLNSVFIFCVGPTFFWCYAKGRMSLNGCQWLVVTWRGENEAVAFGNMNVLNSAFIHCANHRCLSALCASKIVGGLNSVSVFSFTESKLRNLILYARNVAR